MSTCDLMNELHSFAADAESVCCQGSRGLDERRTGGGDDEVPKGLFIMVSKCRKEEWCFGDAEREEVGKHHHFGPTQSRNDGVRIGSSAL